VADKKHIRQMQKAVERLHKCSAEHAFTVLVKENSHGKAIWTGEVEVFKLSGHPEAQRAYVWSEFSGKGDSTAKIVAVLQIPPVNSPESAIDAHRGPK